MKVQERQGRYFSCHNHTPSSNYRLLDCINKPKDLFDRAIEIGLSGFAVTDHEALSAHIEIMEYRDKLIKEGKLPEDFIVSFGNEAYLVDELGMGITYYHWLLIAKDAKGHEILRKLSTQAWENSYTDRGMERVPITKAQVERIMEENDGYGHIMSTSACLGGELGKNALDIRDIENDTTVYFKEIEINKRKKKMEDYVLWNQKVFGKDNFFIELAPNDKADQRFSNNMLKNVARAYDARLIFSTDSHYLTKEDQPIHRAFLHSKEGEREVDEFYSTAYMMELDEVWEYMSLDFSEEEFLVMLDNLEYMKEQIGDYSLFREQEIPVVPVVVPEKIYIDDLGEKYPFLNKMLNSDEEQDVYWSRTCLNELEKRGKWNSEYISALELEAETLVEISKRMGQSMASYYNTAQVLVQLMWTKGNSLVGTSRGSAMAFLSNWLLDITQLDPLPYKIPFWRHLSKGRPELPDVDLDSEGFKREDVLNAVKDYFGEDRVLNIITYGTEGTKSAIATACRGLDIDNDVALYLSGLVPNERGFDWSLSDMVKGNKEKDRKPIQEFIRTVEQHPNLLETAMKIEGMVTKRGSHASGVYIYNHDYTETSAMMKAPNGLKVTQWNMDESDKMGGLKFDFLSIEALDKIRATMDLLIDDGLMEDKGGLKETYDHYLHPSVLDYSEEMWEPSWDGKVLDLFQLQTPVGGEAIHKGKPRNIVEAAAINSLMRLMPLNGEAPIDKFARMKANIQLWYEELHNYGIQPNEVEVLERHYLQSYGVPNTQEELMLLLMDEDVCGFSQEEANMARKIIGKKQMDRIPELRQKIFNERKCSKEMIQYVWDTAVSVQLGYAFSLPHTVGYSAIALQELNLFNKYPSIYWNTACLVVNSGGEGSGTDYAKIAVALSRVRKHGISISTVDINKSEKEFKPDVQNNQVLYGFKPLTGISDEYIDEIIANRPYAGLVDFLDKVKTDKTKATSLIKSGAFDDLEGGRRLSLAKYAMLRTNYRKSIAITILPTLDKFDLLPQEMKGQHAIFEFNRYVKNQLIKDNGYYSFDERASDFFSKNFDTAPLILGPLGNEMILISDWEKIYKKGMDPAREWLKANKEDLFETLFYLESSKEFEEIGEGSISKWEMDAMSFYHSEHELANVDYRRYNISDYTKLPSEPQRTKNGRYSRYVTCTIVGTCLARNKTKGQAYILTREGEVVLLKMPKGKFSYYDKQISEPIPGTDKKKIVERSWFGKGNKILVHGFRRGSQFIPKTYTDTAMPSVALITDVSDNGELKIRTERGV